MKIEIDKPVVPKFVADWIERLKAKGDSKHSALSVAFGLSSVLDDCVYDWFVNNKDDFVTAVMYGYEIEQEPRYYAKIKGWELATSESVFWNYRCIIERPILSKLYVSGKENFGSFKTRMTIEQWNKLGINDTNADFERVE